MNNPNILGDLKPVKTRTSQKWRYKSVKTDYGVYDDYENRYSDNDGHQTSFPIPPTVRRK